MGEELQPALRATKGTDDAIELTHSGWSNPAGVPRSTLQRVSYRLEDTDLVREYWHVLDRTQTVEPVSVVLLDKVKSVSVRYLGADRDWKDQWPPLGYSGVNVRTARPLAVEITLELEDWGEIKRLVEVGG
jgi:general secretion pathway protein J